MTDLVLQYCHFPLYALSFPELMEVPTVVVVVLKLYRNYFLQLFRHEHLGKYLYPVQLLEQAKKLPGLATGTGGGASLGGMALGVPAPPLPNI